MATTTMNWENLIKAVEIDVVDSAPDAKVVEPTILMIQKLRLLRPVMAIGVTSAVLPTAVSVICVCIARAMTRGLKQTSSGSSTPTAPNMPRGASEHADVGPDNRCVTQFRTQALADMLEQCIDTC